MIRRFEQALFVAMLLVFRIHFHCQMSHSDLEQDSADENKYESYSRAHTVVRLALT